jgi:hypothetical protein
MMQTLSGTVGEAGANARHDAALVQAILVLSERPATLDPRRSHYLTDIDGDCGPATKQAIRQFQYDQVFVSARGGSSQAVAGATAGRITPGDTTWTKLVAAVPRQFIDLRVLPTSKTVYVGATAGQRDASLARVAQLTFEATFRNNVVAVIRRLYDDTGIVCSVCRDGDRRTFQTQYDIYTSPRNVNHSITGAGPGESNHNFGQGVDLGFQGLRWLRTNGTVVENEDWWMHQLDPAQRATGESLIFWNVLRDTGAQLGLFRGPANDRPHLQAWNDAGIDMADRLADLSTRSGRMRWTGRNQRYQCDLGFGGRYFDVGSAAQIWNRQATITEAVLNQARGQGAGQPAAPGAPAGRGGAAVATPPAAPAATVQDVATTRSALRDDFDAADLAWQNWRPR